MSNVILSVMALVISGLPQTDGALADRDINLAAIFRSEDDSPLSRPLDRPAWLRQPQQNLPVFRGQGPGGMYQGPPQTAPLMNPYQPQNPFMGGADPVQPYLNEPGPTVISGINGPQPQRLGFTPFFDTSFISPSTVKSPGQGHLGIQAYDAELRHVGLIDGDCTFTNAAQGGARIWDGPNKPDLPGSVFRFGWDFLLHSPTFNGWSGQLDFNPSINTDLQASLGREAFNFDANATAYYHVSPQLMLVIGVQYWDRVHDIFIPNAGVVWNPTDRLEMRLLFPKSKISYFVGNHGNGAHWLYATGEYHVESYQIQMPGVSDREQIQLSDWRVAVGLRSDHQWYDKFLEVGYVFGRKADFLHSTPDFNIGDGIMARMGVRF